MRGFARPTKLEASTSDILEISAENLPLPSQTPTSPQTPANPVLRNFSYPTSITLDTRPASKPTSCLVGPTTWNQRGVICSFSPDNILRAGTVELEHKNSYLPSTNTTTQKVGVERSHPIPSVSQQDRRPIDLRPSNSFTKSTTLRENIEVGNKKHTSQGNVRAQNQSLQSHTLKTTQSERTKLVDNTSGEERTHSHSSNIAIRCRSGLLGHQRAARSLELSQLFDFDDERSRRPVSSSGAPVVKAHRKDSRLEDNQLGLKDHTVVVISPIKALRQGSRGLVMEQIRRRSITSSEELRVGRQDGAKARKGKESRGGWMSHIREWLSTSEPSTQALKNYKKEAFKRAGTSPDDPRATAKLHIPTATLPPEAIKPSGRGLDPEDVLRKETERKKRLRQSFQTIASSSGGSRSSASRHSSLSSLPFKEPREES
ncbi:hypothetical protein PFICI_00573 [Pestalotiopsis fici W106-1]|uniref:Uncharacterized protein n=1 Tax=Pestalotiopsis fici (strain W106-1 / CGMCC3.15140) TaxID=1229662 RepID=W3XL97_PESFW|nr:uncharacterized protein PFICI_00573 [Pestalotiopsis fici W106-1]ETS86745.1 hypothetical protein PFICI_00573 [Pestalotiopsis fici W106-1]